MEWWSPWWVSARCVVSCTVLDSTQWWPTQTWTWGGEDDIGKDHISPWQILPPAESEAKGAPSDSTRAPVQVSLWHWPHCVMVINWSFPSYLAGCSWRTGTTVIVPGCPSPNPEWWGNECMSDSPSGQRGPPCPTLWIMVTATGICFSAFLPPLDVLIWNRTPCLLRNLPSLALKE